MPPFIPRACAAASALSGSPFDLCQCCLAHLTRCQDSLRFCQSSSSIPRMLRGVALHRVTPLLQALVTSGNVRHMSNSAAQVIDAKGGPAAFAAKVNRRPGAVRAWKHRNYFPREAWPEIINAFPDLGLDSLIEIEAHQKALGDLPKPLGAAERD